MEDEAIVRAALRASPRWHVIHWGTPESSTLLCLWVAGRETIVPVDGDHVTYAGRRWSILDGGLTELLRDIERTRDAAALATAAAEQAQSWLVQQWQQGDGAWTFPRGGYVRWEFNGGLHVEASDGGPLQNPLPESLRDVLVDLGWRSPDGRFRNCWVRPGPDLEQAAALCVLTPMAAFGYEAPPPV